MYSTTFATAISALGFETRCSVPIVSGRMSRKYRQITYSADKSAATPCFKTLVYAKAEIAAYAIKNDKNTEGPPL
jgi:hypothetical protein